MDIAKLDQKSKCIFAIKLGERASLYFKEDNVKGLINEALKDAWEWVQTGRDVGETLYDFLDNEENGFTLFQEMEENPQNINAWDCIIDAIAYISKAAYEKKGVKYLPEPIEIVDDNIFSHMIHGLILCDSMESEYIENAYQNCLKKDN